MPDADAPIDLGSLSRMLGSEDEKYLKEMIRFFWDTMVDTPGELATLIAARDAGVLRDAAHAAKGASASVAAEPLSALLKDLQLAATNADWQRIDVLLPMIDKAFSELEEFIGKLKIA